MERSVPKKTKNTMEPTLLVRARQGFPHYAFIESMRCEEGIARAQYTIICEREIRGITKMAKHDWETTSSEVLRQGARPKRRLITAC